MSKSGSSNRWLRLALILGFVAVVLMPVAALGTQFLGWPVQTGLTVFAFALPAAVLSLLIILIAFLKLRRSRKMRWYNLIPYILPALLVLLFLLRLFSIQRDLPPIHNISTDTSDPPDFVALESIRERSGSNPSAYRHPSDDQNLAEVQRSAYPDIQPVLSDLSADAAFDKALALVRESGWEVVNADRARHLIEATDTTLWFGFKDDVIIRVQPRAAGSRIDLRSVSRVGIHDFGANAGRIRAFMSLWRQG